MRKCKMKNIILVLTLLGFTGLLIYMALQSHISIGFNNEVTLKYNNDWKIVRTDQSKDAVVLPAKVECNADGEIVLEHQLPQHILEGLCFAIWSEDQVVTAKVNNELIYEVNNTQQRVFGKTNGNLWNIIRISEVYKGQNIRIHIKPVYGEKVSKVYGVYVGTKASVFYSLIKRYCVGVFLSFFMLLLGIILAGISLAFRKKLEQDLLRKFLYLAAFCFLMTICLVGHSKIAQFVIGNQYMILLMRYVGPILVPVPLLYYVADIRYNHMKYVLLFCSYACIATAALVTTIQILELYDFHYMVYAIYGIIMLSCFTILLNTMMEKYHHRNPHFRYLTTAVLVFFFTSIFEFQGFLSKEVFDSGRFVQIGAIGFILILMTETLQKSLRSLEISKTAKYYEQLANVDIMANCYSRTAYNQDIADLIARNQYEDVGFIFFDLNFLKKINDDLGHKYGDQAIMVCSQYIRRIFDKVGKTYRMGGDEFITIVQNCSSARIPERVDLLSQMISEKNDQVEYSLSIACGWAVYNQEEDHTLEDVVQRADAMMYRNKSQMKEKDKQ